jgi:hypothetical protein
MRGLAEAIHKDDGFQHGFQHLLERMLKKSNRGTPR